MGTYYQIPTNSPMMNKIAFWETMASHYAYLMANSKTAKAFNFASDRLQYYSALLTRQYN